ncbi:MAG: 2,3-bisphosphoglycerate-independent phosphoglycerate mutase [bacterium]
MVKNKIILVILDGWGIGPDYKGNAIKLAKTPTMDSLAITFPYTQLLASGEAVGLPKGEAGNTETGHLNIGAGCIVYQDLPRINMSIAGGSFFTNPAFLKTVEHVKKNKSKLHLLGLVGQGGVHSSNDHLYALLRLCKQQKLSSVYLHLITDGRDSPPMSSPNYLQEVMREIVEIGIGQINTIIGRYFAMDRDHRWERTKIAYDALVNGIGEKSDDFLSTLTIRHTSGETDEFIKPIIVTENSKPTPRIVSNDAVIFFNYRIDRPRQLTKALVLDDQSFTTHAESFDPYAVKYKKSHLYQAAIGNLFARPNLPKNLLFTTMTEYEKDLPCEIAFPPEFVKMPLSRVIALAGKRQLKLAESEKERFVTYYFNGQRELPFPGEDVQITASPKIPTYDLQPEMSGEEQTEKLLKAIQSDLYDLIVINYANPDMVAHTGNLASSILACQFVDGWIKKIYQTVMQHEELILLITADHGNVEELINLKTGGIDTEHSQFPVPLYVIGKQFQNKHKRLPQGILGDIAPTILKLLGIQKPSSMSGRSLI